MNVGHFSKTEWVCFVKDSDRNKAWPPSHLGIYRFVAARIEADRIPVLKFINSREHTQMTFDAKVVLSSGQEVMDGEGTVFYVFPADLGKVSKI